MKLKLSHDYGDFIVIGKEDSVRLRHCQQRQAEAGIRTFFKGLPA